ncbi:hypothetical protein WJX73_004624 [Symbiochloris irregularis]|uniref:Myb-like domain-containing protein n=1 Tax=Symbiochloris irregularis TaxID=706552 RepID=A0AAW1PZH1_9CHLO
MGGKQQHNRKGSTVNMWTAAEDRILKEKVAELGHSWGPISTFLPGRTIMAVTNHWSKLYGKSGRKSSAALNQARQVREPEPEPASTEQEEASLEQHRSKRPKNYRSGMDPVKNGVKDWVPTAFLSPASKAARLAAQAAAKAALPPAAERSAVQDESADDALIPSGPTMAQSRQPAEQPTKEKLDRRDIIARRRAKRAASSELEAVQQQAVQEEPTVPLPSEGSQELGQQQQKAHSNEAPSSQQQANCAVPRTPPRFISPLPTNKGPDQPRSGKPTKFIATWREPRAPAAKKAAPSAPRQRGSIPAQHAPPARTSGAPTQQKRQTRADAAD